jgi:acyl dehydratase
MHEPLPFDKLTIGDRHVSPARTVTETDVVQFAGMTADFGPIHTDHEFAAQTPFGKPIAHGLMGLAWVAGMAHYFPWVQTEALLSLQEWKFLKPIFIGDTLHLVNEVIDLKPKGKRRGRVVWRRQLVNQRGEIVQEGLFETYVAMSRGPAKGRHLDAKEATCGPANAEPLDSDAQT